ncbi:energy transducer TonB, partial [uncultured Fusobacterium sp.]
TIVQSHKKLGFDDAVISALKKWRFAPIYYNNEIIKVYFQKEFVFESKK